MQVEPGWRRAPRTATGRAVDLLGLIVSAAVAGAAAGMAAAVMFSVFATAWGHL